MWPILQPPSPDPNVLERQRQALTTSAWPLGSGSRNETTGSSFFPPPPPSHTPASGGHAVVAISPSGTDTRVSKSDEEPFPPYHPTRVEAFTAVILCLLVAGFVAVACVFPYQGTRDVSHDDRRWEVTLARWFAKNDYPAYTPFDALLTPVSGAGNDTRTAIETNPDGGLEGSEGISNAFSQRADETSADEAPAPDTDA
jgi:hypothetical protein